MCPPSARPIAHRGPGRYCQNCNTRNSCRSLRCYNCNSFVTKKRGRPRKYKKHPSYRDIQPIPRLTFYSLPTTTTKASQPSNSTIATMSDHTPPSSNPLSPSQPQEEASSDLPTSSRSPSQPSTSQSAQPLNDFMGMLKMRRSSEDSTGSKGVKESNGGGGGVGSNGGGAVVKKSNGERVKERNGEGEVEDMETESGPGKVQETLVDKFKKDPNSVLQLLESALTMDKIGSLLSKHHRQDKKKVEELRSKLEAAYHTLKECAQQKGVLTEKIQVTNEKIKAKRKHLESLREELRVLGEEELQLKRKRDASYTNCADLKKKLKCSRDALQQLAVLAPPKGKEATVGEASQHA